MGAPDSDAENRRRALLANPFWVLGLAPCAGTVEVEREGAKLLAMLAAGAPGADRYETPVGPAVRTAELVRLSLAEMRDPDRRAVHEWWARGTSDQ